MASIGELFIELGVVGDVKPLEKTLKTMKQTTAEMERQYKAAKRLEKYLKDYRAAKARGSKAEIADLKKQFEIAVRKDNEWKLANKIDEKKEFAAKIAGVVKGVGLFVGAMTGAAVALNKFTNDLVQSNQAMLDLTRTTDIAQGTFQKWNNIGKMLGVENAAQQLEGLNQRMFELMLTGEGARGFQLAGINPVGQDANGVLEQLRDRVSGMSDTAATYLLQQMGLDPKMLHLLRMSRTEFEELGQTIKKYQLTPEQTKQIQAMNIQLQIAGIKLRYLKDRAILALMPYWTKFVQWVAKVSEKLVSFVKWVKDGSSWGAKLTKTILTLVAAFAAWAATTTIVAKAIGFVTMAVNTLKVAFLALTAHPIIAGLTLLAGAIMLIADDIIGYNNGKNSVIGAIIKGLEDLDLKGYIDFPVPKWLEYLIEVIHFYQSGGFNQGVGRENLHKDIIKGDYSLLFETGDPGRDAAIERLKKMEKIKHNLFLNDNAKNDAIIKLLTTPAMQQNVRNNNSTVNNSPSYTQNITMHTEQPAYDAERMFKNMFTYTRNAIMPTGY